MDVPVLPEVEVLRLEHALSQVEIAQLKIVVLQERMGQQQQFIEGLTKAAVREGFGLRRESPGQWSYSPTVTAPSPTEKPDAKKGGDQ